MTTPTDLPVPWDFCRVWETPSGQRRSFSTKYYNGMPCTKTVPVFTADQMRDYAQAALTAQSAEIALQAEVVRQLSEQNTSLDAEVARLEKIEDRAIEIETKLRGEAREIGAEIARLRRDVEANAKLARFGAWCAREFRDSLADVDGGSAQNAMERFGVIVKTEVTESCGEGCVCVEYREFPHACYKFPDEIVAAIRSLGAGSKEGG